MRSKFRMLTIMVTTIVMIFVLPDAAILPNLSREKLLTVET